MYQGMRGNFRRSDVVRGSERNEAKKEEQKHKEESTEGVAVEVSMSPIATPLKFTEAWTK